MRYFLSLICFFLTISHVLLAQQTDIYDIVSNENEGSRSELDDELQKLIPYIQAIDNFSRNIPQEKVYLHFDNTSYYQGDQIWFKCYVVTSGRHQLSPWSKTMYVELLNPGGDIVDKRILKIEKGQCHGDFSLNHLPFYSGFYEIRAYTKYMLNFGDDVIFSRVLPVFDKPKKESNFEEKKMLGYGRYGPLGSFSMKREPPVRGSRVNMRFFPEGGNLVQGVESRVAFEVTDAAGNPLTIDSGQLTIGGNEIPITAQHEGKGVFTYTPSGGRRNDIAEIEYSGKKYRFDLPACLPQGVVMEVDNLSHADSIRISLRKNKDFPVEMLGVAVLNGGALKNYCFAWIEDTEIHFKMDKTRLPAGVSQIVLFNSQGEIVCDRLIFCGNHDVGLNIKAKTGKSTYRPYELVNFELSVTDKDENPVYTSFSLSVRDGANMVEGNHTILTDLLLMSEIKEYVRNPLYYFEEDDEAHRAALDILLMVQGWRRYAWKQMADVETLHATSLSLKYLPEQGIETHGKILYKPIFGKVQPKPKVDVGLLLTKREEDETNTGFVETFVTDNQGRFAFVSNISDRWNMILSVREKGKPKNYQIVLDRVFSPELRRYRYADLQVNITEVNNEDLNDEETNDELEEDYDIFMAAYADSLARLGMDEKTHHLPEVTVRAKKRTKEQDILHNRTTSVAYYDVASEMDDLYDRGDYFLGNDIHAMLMKMNEFFSIRRFNSPDGLREFLYYKGKMMVFVVDYEQTTWNEFGYFKYQNIRPSAIKSIYINENTSNIAQYIHQPNPRGPSPMVIAMSLGCAVFIETYPDGEIPVDGAKGVRKTWLEGYSPVKEFYSPDYSALPPEPDYRRTLYWNPMVTPDENGHVKINFYNNSSCRNFNISAETITPLGVIGVLFTGQSR